MAIRTKWRIGKKARACTGCEEAFPFDTDFHSVIHLVEEAFVRRDLCGACWEKNEDVAFSSWVTQIPKPEQKKRQFDLGLAAEFLRKLAVEDDGERGPLAHLLAILLVRKRAIRIRRMPQDEAGPRIKVEFLDGHEPVVIHAPPLTAESVEPLKEELGNLLDLGGPPEPEQKHNDGKS
ncbi:MAG: hypothetical protein ACYTDX_05450 [Planctomycetota bacterium]|jgi:hypothetical protein